jgi:transcriptional regulator with XRE-family HTH domain
MFGPHGGNEREDLLDGLRSLLAREMPTSAVKARREELGLSQHGLARASDVSQPVISRVEAGEQMLTREAQRKVAVALKMDEHDPGLKESLAFMRRSSQVDSEFARRA